jgi:hypothetical protein
VTMHRVSPTRSSSRTSPPSHISICVLFPLSPGLGQAAVLQCDTTPQNHCSRSSPVPQSGFSKRVVVAVLFGKISKKQIVNT